MKEWTQRTICLMVALLLWAASGYLPAKAQSENALRVFSVTAGDEKLDVALYSTVEARTDTLEMEMAGKKCKPLKVQPYRDSEDGCSYLIIQDMPDISSSSLKKNLLASYQETLSFIFSTMRDEDNAAITDTSFQSGTPLPFKERNQFFSTIKDMQYKATPNTLNAAIDNALDYLQSKTQELRRRTCLIVLTNGFGKSEEGMSTQDLLRKIDGTKTTIYIMAYPTTSRKEEEIQKLRPIAEGSCGGQLFTCAASVSSDQRQIILNKFQENEKCFYQAEADISALTAGDNCSTLTATVSTKNDRYGHQYVLSQNEQNDVKKAIRPAAEETAQPEPTQEVEEKTEDTKEQKKTILIIGGGAALLIALAVVCIVVVKSRKKETRDSEEQLVPVNDQPSKEAPIADIRRNHIRVTLSQVGMNETAHYEADMVDSLTIGRDPQQARMLLPDDMKVSKLHAKLTFDGSAMRLEDCGSTNGTRVNGVKISAPCIIQQGDEVSFGRTNLRIRWSKV